MIIIYKYTTIINISIMYSLTYKNTITQNKIYEPR